MVVFSFILKHMDIEALKKNHETNYLATEYERLEKEKGASSLKIAIDVDPY